MAKGRDGSKGRGAPEEGAEEPVAAEGATGAQESPARDESIMAGEPAAAEHAAPPEGSALAEEPALADEPSVAEEPALAEASGAGAEGVATQASALVQEHAQEPAAAAGNIVAKSLDELQKSGTAQLQAASITPTSLAASLLAIVAEATDYSKRSLDNRLAFYERLRTAKTFENAIEIQSEYAKTSYAGLVAETEKMRELYSDLAKVAFRPIHAAIAPVLNAKLQTRIGTQ